MPDKERPLNKRGRKDAPRMGKLLRRYEFQPDLMVTSPAQRALSTAQLIAAELGYQEPLQVEKGIYESKVSWIMNMIRKFPENRERVMIFGHNPTFEALIEQLLEMDGSVVLPTCGMACLEMPLYSWRDATPGAFNLKWFLIPRLVSGNPA